MVTFKWPSFIKTIVVAALAVPLVVSATLRFAGSGEAPRDCNKDLGGRSQPAEQSFFENLKYQLAWEINQAMQPLILDYNHAASALSDEEIVKRVAEIKRSVPIETSGFDWRRFNRTNPYQVWGPAKIMDMYSPDDYVYRSLTNAASSIQHRFFDGNSQLFEKSEAIEFMRPDSSPELELGYLDGFFSLVMTPKGFYSSDFDHKRMIATRLMIDLAKQSLVPTAERVFFLHHGLLTDETARAMSVNSEKALPARTPVAAMIEGIVSVHQLISLMMAVKIPGMESPSEILRAIVKSKSSKVGLLSDATGRLPMGFVGPATIGGVHFKKPILELNSGNQLILTDEFKKYFNERNKRELGQRKGICPFATLFGKGVDLGRNPELPHPTQTGIQEIAEIYLRVFEIVDRMEDSKP